MALSLVPRRESEAILAVSAWVDAMLTGVVAGQRKKGPRSKDRGPESIDVA